MIGGRINKSLKYNVSELERIFNDLFKETEKTELVSGGDEPIYLPCSDTHSFAQIISTHDYFSSCLHEVSHWCIAGDKRRQLVDFGYWYEPDGRTAAQQKDFEQVEVKPQALEWLFSEACGVTFQLSVDNLESMASMQEFTGASLSFKQRVLDQTLSYIELDNAPKRAKIFIAALLQYFRPEVLKLEKSAFSMSVLN